MLLTIRTRYPKTTACLSKMSSLRTDHNFLSHSQFSVSPSFIYQRHLGNLILLLHRNAHFHILYSLLSFSSSSPHTHLPCLNGKEKQKDAVPFAFTGIFTSSHRRRFDSLTSLQGGVDDDYRFRWLTEPYTLEVAWGSEDGLWWAVVACWDGSLEADAEILAR